MLEGGGGGQQALFDLNFQHATTKTWAYFGKFGFFRKNFGQKLYPTPAKVAKMAQHGGKNCAAWCQKCAPLCRKCAAWCQKMCGMVSKMCGMLPKMCSMVAKICVMVPKNVSHGSKNMWQYWICLIDFMAKIQYSPFSDSFWIFFYPGSF